MKYLNSLILAALLALGATPADAQQVSVAVFPFSSLSSGDRWIADGMSRDLIEKVVRTPELRPIEPERVTDRLQSVLTKEHSDPNTLPLSVQLKVGEWTEADRILVGLVGPAGRRENARSFLDGLSVVPSVTPEGSEAWIAAKLIDVHRGMTVSWAFAEGSRDGYSELQDAIYLQIIADVGIDPGGMPFGTIGRPTELTRAYRLTLEGESILKEQRREKDQPKQWRRAEKRFLESLKLDPAYARTYLYLGHARRNQGDLDGALSAYGQASALDPNYAGPRMAISESARDAGDDRQELLALQSVLEAIPWHDVAYERLSELHERAGRLQIAASNYDQAIRLSEGDTGRLYRAGSLHLRMSNYEQAIRYLNRAVERVPGQAKYHAQLVRALTGSEQLDRAVQALDVANSIGVESTDLWLAAGEVAMQGKDYAAAERAFLRVLAAEPGRSDARLMVAKLMVMRGDHQSAIDAYKAALSDGVPMIDVVQPLAEAYVGTGQPDQAAQLYKQALEQYPNRVSWLMARARILIEAMRHAEAIPPLRKVLESEPDNLDAIEWVAASYGVVGNDREAIRAYDRLLSLDPDRTYVLPRQGDLLYRVRDYTAARDAYRAAVENGHTSSDVYAGLGLSEEELRHYRSARTAYTRALDLDLGNEIAKAGLQRMRSKIKPPRREPTAAEWAARGRSRMADGDVEGAIAAFSRSLTRDSDNAGVLNDIGAAYAVIGDLGKARNAFQLAERLEPTPETVYNLGRLSFQEGKGSEAMLNYQIALRRDETHLRAAQNLAALQAGSDDPYGAVETLRDIRRHHQQHGGIAIALGNAYFQAGELGQAASVYSDSRTIEGATADAQIGLGNVALAQGDTSAAIDHYREAMAADPDNPDPRVNLGTILVQQGAYSDAVLEFQKALEQDPTDLALYLNLAVLYYHTEQYPEALEYCRAIIERDQSMMEAQRLIGDIATATEQLELAVEAYDAVLGVSRDDLHSILGIAEALNGLERTDEARDYWQRWLDLVGEDPNYAEQAESITRKIDPEPEDWFNKQLEELRSLL